MRSTEAITNFDLRNGWLVIWQNAVESWFNDHPGAEYRAEVVSTSDTGKVAEVWLWHWPAEAWICAYRYKNGKLL